MRQTILHPQRHERHARKDPRNLKLSQERSVANQKVPMNVVGQEPEETKNYIRVSKYVKPSSIPGATDDARRIQHLFIVSRAMDDNHRLVGSLSLFSSWIRYMVILNDQFSRYQISALPTSGASTWSLKNGKTRTLHERTTKEKASSFLATWHKIKTKQRIIISNARHIIIAFCALVIRKAMNRTWVSFSRCGRVLCH
jgi:hypothetical protein